MEMGTMEMFMLAVRPCAFGQDRCAARSAPKLLLLSHDHEMGQLGLKHGSSQAGQRPYSHLLFKGC
eukprot:583039-Pelagomonas_calceolata.AAC.1